MDTRKVLLVLAALAAGVVSADGFVDRTVPRDVSGKWDLVIWDGYVPYGQRTAETVDGRAAQHFRGVTSIRGGGITCFEKIPVREGARVKVTFEAKGSGKAAGSLLWLTSDGQANNTVDMPWFDLTSEWRTYTFTPRVLNGNRPTCAFNYRFNIQAGADAYVANVRYAVEHAEGEDFEDASAPLVGGATPAKIDIAPGLLRQTGVGLWKGGGTRTIAFADNVFRLPQFMEKPFFASAFRLYPFGRVERRSSKLESVFAGAAGRGFKFVIDNDAAKETMDCAFVDVADGRETRLGAVAVRYTSLPADFELRAHPDGRVTLSVKSLSDSATYVGEAKSAFFADNAAPFAASLVFRPGSDDAELMLDNYTVGPGNPETKLTPVPFAIDRFPTFDPVKAGWKLAFSDEFDGAALDPAKWFVHKREKSGYYSRYREENAYLKDGFLHIRTDWDEEHKGLTTASVWSKYAQLYGYFEARLRFTKQSGWWAAFWMWSHSVTNPFLDGFEIDIFEDYYTRSLKPDGEHKGRLDHNIHMTGAGALKSWNYGSMLPGSLDDFYTLGCKWTPFEISYYLNGKLIASKATHSDYDGATFDAITHGTGLAPLVPILSGQIMGPGYATHDPTGFTFPEEFLVDWIRVYEFPQEGIPTATLASAPDSGFVRMGDKITFTADVKPGADGAAIKAVYLFDSGYLLDYRTKPPYAFDVTFDEKYYGKTRWKRPGRSGKKPELLNSGTHAFAVFALDEKGRYGHSALVEKSIGDLAKSRPYQGVAAQIPGVVKLGRYDEGGEAVAYHDNDPKNTSGGKFRTDEGVDAWGETSIGGSRTGEWMTYTVDITEAGDYRAELTYGTPVENAKYGLRLFVDGTPAGRIACPSYPNGSWSATAVGVLDRVTLPAGRHRLTVMVDGSYNLGTLTFTKAKAAACADADLDFLAKLVAIPSASTDFPQVTRAMHAMKDYLEPKGVYCTLEKDAQGREILFAATKPGKVQDYILSAHLDVVPASVPGQYEMKTEPDGRLVGRGVEDDKNGSLIVAQTLIALAGTEASVGCIFGGDEETGGFTTTWMVEEKGYRPRRMVMVVDSSYGKIGYATKGQLMVRATVKGKGGHSSAPWACEDLISQLSEAVVKVKAEWYRRHPLAEDHWSDVLTPTIVRSEGDALNRIPSEVWVNFNLRSVRPEAKDECVALIRELTKGDVEVVRYSPPCSSRADDPYVLRLRQAMANELKAEVPLERMPFATDARCFVSCNVPVVNIGGKGGGAHGTYEWADPTTIGICTRYLVKFLTDEYKK